jgi:3-hydroxyacyl-CoA dehydrogenase
VKEDLKISRNISVDLFNPARYLKLFEIIPGPATSQEVLDFLLYTERNF